MQITFNGPFYAVLKYCKKTGRYIGEVDRGIPYEQAKAMVKEFNSNTEVFSYSFKGVIKLSHSVSSGKTYSNLI